MPIIDDIFKGGVEGIFSGIRSVIGAFKVDPTIAANNAQKLAELEVAVNQAALQAETQLALAQSKINEIEAASTDKFTSRWRPFIGWCCGFGVVYCVLFDPFLTWLSASQGWPAPPTLDPGVLQTILFAMLGIGGMRSFDKMKGTSK